ncbi:alanine racemase [bacterium]|nr:alanine racemase [bacterium]
MNRLTINLHALKQNIDTINGWMEEHGADWTIVTKVLCGHSDTLKALQLLGVRSMADSRLANIRAIERVNPEFEAWYLRLPHMPAIPEIVELTDASLNSEIETIEALNEEAKKHGKVHRIIIMIELGDLREGILPGNLVDFYSEIFKLEHIEVLGIGANLGCLSGAVPNIDQYTQLALYRELLELKFERRLPWISAGTSATLPLLLEGKVPKSINHFRIGESVFLGTDLLNEGTLPGMRDDACILEADVVEIKEKSLVPFGETSTLAPFAMELSNDEEETPAFGQRGYRAILTLGGLDTDVGGLTPVNPDYKIAGASSDLLVVNVGEEPGDLKIGDTIKFHVNYTALLRLMSGKYIEKTVVPSTDAFAKKLGDDIEDSVPRLLDGDNLQETVQS